MNLTQAMKVVFADMRRDINEIIYQQLTERNIPFKKGFDFYGLIESLVRKAGFKGPDLEDGVQQIVMQMLVRKGGKSIFDLFDPQRGTQLERWFYTAVNRRVINLIEQRSRQTRERPTDFMPSDEGDPSSMDQGRIPSRSQETGEEEYQDLINEFEERLKKHRLGDTLLTIFGYLIKGWSKGQITQELGFKSPSRLSYYLMELKNVLKDYVVESGNPDLARAFSKALQQEA
jgi:DNA-directed RNA polymerase specialized sigma24 family protein